MVTKSVWGGFAPAPQTLWKATGPVIGLTLATCIINCMLVLPNVRQYKYGTKCTFYKSVERAYKGNNIHVPGPLLTIWTYFHCENRSTQTNFHVKYT